MEKYILFVSCWSVYTFQIFPSKHKKSKKDTKVLWGKQKLFLQADLYAFSQKVVFEKQAKKRIPSS